MWGGTSWSSPGITCILLNWQWHEASKTGVAGITGRHSGGNSFSSTCTTCKKCDSSYSGVCSVLVNVQNNLNSRCSDELPLEVLMLQVSDNDVMIVGWNTVNREWERGVKNGCLNEVTSLCYEPLLNIFSKKKKHKYKFLLQKTLWSRMKQVIDKGKCCHLVFFISATPFLLYSHFTSKFRFY